MPIQITLDESTDQCTFVPLAVFGYCLTQSGVLRALWSKLTLDMKTYDHPPTAKLQDMLVAILAGCRSLAQVNSRLRPERVLAHAWQRPAFADQSTLSRTLDALRPADIDQLRAGNLHLLQQFSQLRQHPWPQSVIVDIDPTSLLTSKRAEGSRKGWVSGKKTNIAAMCSGSPWPGTTRVCSRSPIRGTDMAMNIVNRPCSNCSPSGPGPVSNASRLSSAVMRNWVLMPRSVISCGWAFKC